MKLDEAIGIYGFGSVSALGMHKTDIWSAYCDNKTYLKKELSNGEITLMGKLHDSIIPHLNALKEEHPSYKKLDPSVLYGILASRMAFKEALWNTNDNIGVNLGSSRGATESFEKFYQTFLETGKTPTLTSPLTTLGNISTWVLQDLGITGPDFSHSITCSTALHSVVNGIAWIKAGFTNQFLVGGAEASLTPFSIAQMKALKIYSHRLDENYPCLAGDISKTENTMVLGEGAGAMAIGKLIGERPPFAYITGIGVASEPLTHNISISERAECLRMTMEMATQNIDKSKVDAIVMHSPGTIKGDTSERFAIEDVFAHHNTPFITTNKWKIGHTFGASGILSLELALLMLEHQQLIEVPFIEKQNITKEKKINNILVNAVGFGGNAVSLLISKEID
ncbi:beta-ketoacyl synthase N-terminal-like domain-containing protein [Riemerella anatipestifer]|nr:beta-ketoacyl synthase N-terminal-like domain-containing protein [Riemerella anatipestifer]MDY3358436.1 beta-ketoacyl synthase N-terminal-like domain-containing protein [Riemerella anatipestifer]